MVKGEKRVEVVKAYPCPECQALRSRRWDLKKHLVEKHGYSEERAKAVASGVGMMWEERSSRLWHSEESSRYARQRPKGE